MKELKIIFCTDGIFPFGIGGMQRHSRYLIEYLSRNKSIDIIVVHPHEEKVFHLESNIHEFFIKPIDTHKIYLLECYRYSKRVFKIIDEHPDYIVYSQGLSVWYNIKKISKRLIINPHGLESFQTISFKEKLIGFPFKLIFSYLFNHSAYVVSLGGMLTTILNKTITNKNSKVIVLPNGVKSESTTKKKQFNTDKINLLFVARFAPNKGIHILMQVITELNNEGWQNKLQFNLGGRGPLYEHYTTNFKFENVNYLGFISDEHLINLYKQADIFVFPTLFEGMPTVVLEAMSYGLPIIVSNVGATAELVDSSNGYLIEKNNVEALKKAIINFYDLTTSSKENLSEASLQRIKDKYDWEIVTKNYIELFQKLTDDLK